MQVYGQIIFKQICLKRKQKSSSRKDGRPYMARYSLGDRCYRVGLSIKSETLTPVLKPVKVAPTSLLTFFKERIRCDLKRLKNRLLVWLYKRDKLSAYSDVDVEKVRMSPDRCHINLLKQLREHDICVLCCVYRYLKMTKCRLILIILSKQTTNHQYAEN